MTADQARQRAGPSTLHESIEPDTTAAEPGGARGPLAAQTTDGLVITVERAAQRLDIGRMMFLELIRSGQTRTIRIGRLRKVPVESLRELVRRQGVGDPAQPLRSRRRWFDIAQHLDAACAWPPSDRSRLGRSAAVSAGLDLVPAPQGACPLPCPRDVPGPGYRVRVPPCATPPALTT
ncbi:hypothetical protein CAE01nite_07750 [Cellulomonas aerilata]|uniref:Helix-turn-helix domain-containing protein n=1 Tax=Cellulomonas aerilata TaxID=515326 RepID=A0A512D9W6_9CELL|nr:hypothetical protein CAE01nite_07750 [Cellulomonas aerilata]